MHNYDVENDRFLERPCAGSLLLATPMLDDPNFHRSVIYLLEHSDAGSLGLVINRPTEQVVADGLQPWRVLSSAPEVIFEGGPDLEWEADIAWVIRGGADPLDWIKWYGDRITAVHVKDIAPEGQNADEDGWADVGHGTVDWAAIMAALRGTKCSNFVMEHDNPSDHARFASRSIAAAKGF